MPAARTSQATQEHQRSASGASSHQALLPWARVGGSPSLASYTLHTGQVPVAANGPHQQATQRTRVAKGEPGHTNQLSRADPLGGNFKLSDVLADGLQRCLSILARGVLVDPSRGVVYIAKLAC